MGNGRFLCTQGVYAAKANGARVPRSPRSARALRDLEASVAGKCEVRRAEVAADS